MLTLCAFLLRVLDDNLESLTAGQLDAHQHHLCFSTLLIDGEEGTRCLRISTLEER